MVGHRGASGDFPENTLLSFRRALENGADGLEMDVRLSADGVPVVIHDETVDRTTDGSGPVSDLDADQLERLDAGQGEGVPILERVFDLFPDVPMIVELKEVAAAAPTVELVRAKGLQGNVVFGSFERHALDVVSAAGLMRSAGRAEVASLWNPLSSGIDFRRQGVRAFTIPERHRRVLRLVSPRTVERARAQGIPVHVWTVNDPRDARRLRSWGVAGIITNYPSMMSEL